MILAVAVGCSGSGPSEPVGPCAARNGTYSTSYTTRSGDCGTRPEQLFVVHPGDDVAAVAKAAGCTGKWSNTADGCRVTTELTCPGATGYSVHTVDVADWAKDGATGRATEQLTISDAATGLIQCSGTYDLTFSRL